MGDTLSPQASQRAKKRNWLQKPQWLIDQQQKEKEKQLFERSNDCHAEIVAEKERRRKAKEDKAEKARQEERERKDKEDERKRCRFQELMSRNIADAYADAGPPPKRSPEPDSSSPVKWSPPGKRKAEIIELDDSEDEYIPTSRQYPELPKSQFSPKSSTGHDRKRRLTNDSDSRTTPAAVDADDFDMPINPANDEAAMSPLMEKVEEPNPPLQLLIDTRIPDTKPLVVKRNYLDNLRPVRKTWCEKQGFSSERTKSVILTWRGKRLFDVANCKSLGIELNHRGEPVLKVGADGYNDAGDKIVFVATTWDIFNEDKRAAEEAAKRKAEAKPDEEEPPPPQENSIRIVLRSKDRQELKIAVKPVRLRHDFFTILDPNCF